MALPNPGMDFTPFDILTAAEMDNLVENIESLSAGTGFATGAIPTAAIANGAIDYTKVAAGAAVQFVTNSASAVATTTTTIPFDDTIPQIGEGAEFITCTITPKSATNILVVEVNAFYYYSVLTHIVQALFQDATANALTATVTLVGANEGATIPIRYTMVAGTTSATTFRIRAGGSGAGTLTFNGVAGGRLFNTIPKAFMTITEYKV